MASSLLRPTTNEEAAKVREFRASVLFSTMASEFKDSAIMREAHHDDRLIVRFLRARNLELEQALKLFQDMLKWRQAYGTDQALTWQFPSINRLKELYPHGYHKFAKCGMPVYIEKLGSLDASQLIEMFDVPELIKIHVQLKEYSRSVLFPRASKLSNEVVDQQITILDLKGVSLSQCSRKVYQFIQEASFIDQNYYPDILSRMFIINVPMLFSVIWKVISPWIEERVQKKIFITSSSNQTALLELIDASVLPNFLGGNDPSFLATEEESEIRRCANGLWQNHSITCPASTDAVQFTEEQ